MAQFDLENHALIAQAVLHRVRRLLGENPLRLFAEEINGMLYFLTGNCHIRWVS